MEIPRGHYHPTFRLRADLPEQQELDGNDLSAVPDPETNANGSSFADHEPVAAKLVNDSARRLAGRYFSRPIIVAVVFLLILVVGYFAGSYQAHTAIAGDNLGLGTNRFVQNPADPVKMFWANFPGNDRAPIYGLRQRNGRKASSGAGSGR